MAKHGHGGGPTSGEGTRYSSRGLPIHPAVLQHAIRFARNQIGTPYVWGGSAPGGFDCSGLIYWAYRRAGYSGIGRTTYDQIKQGVAISMNHLRPGDIVFPSAHHEGLYVGNGMILEAPHTGDQVKLIPLSSFGFMTARRLLGGGGGIQPPQKIGGVSQNGLPVPHPSTATTAAEWKQFTAETLAAQKQMAAQFAKQQAQMLQQFKSEAAQTRQQSLAQSLAAQQQQKVGAAQAAQQSLNAGASGSALLASSDPAAQLAAERKAHLQSVRDQALRRAGTL